MADKTFYASPSAATRKTDVIPGDGDWYVQEYIFMGTAVYANTTSGISTFTPATSPAWTVDALISTVAKNLIAYDDHSKASHALIADNTAAALTFDETACLHDDDETTPATFTPGSTYNIYVLTPSNVTGQVFGPYFGFAEGVNISITDDIMKFYSGFPERQQFSDIRRREGVVSGAHVNIANKDILKSILGGIDYGKNTAGFESIGIGSSPTRGTFRIARKDIDRNAATNWTVVRQVQFSAAGEIGAEAESGHKMVNFTGDILADAFYPVGADMLLRKRTV